MILVFFILSLFLLLSVLFMFLTISTVKLKIESLSIYNFKIDSKYKVYVQIYLLNRLIIFSKKININKINKITKNEKMPRIRKFNIKFDKNTLSILSKLKPKLEKMKLKIDVGFYDACLTSYIVGILGSVISTTLPIFTTDSKKIKYSILPIYNKDTFKLYLNSIISFKIVHIMYVIYLLLKKGSKGNERTSNRRTYANSYE